MSDEQHLPEHHYDPLTSERPPRRRRNNFAISLGVALLIHAVLGVYLWKTKFEPKYQEYSDTAVKVKLLKAAPPPPPPPPP
ncbi:MAG TPA: energy transducer TonB, partial [Caulobacteraceae bacterium]|nr:energy transducer TonB [Caulobacteraceae bacterium]